MAIRQSFRPGELLEKIDILRETLTSDGMGGSDVTTATVYSVRAHVRPMSGNEVTNWDQVSAPHMYLIVIRRLSDITEKDRISWRGNEYNIRSISDNGPRALYIELQAERRVAQ